MVNGEEPCWHRGIILDFPSLTERWLGNHPATRLLALINNNLWGGTSEALGSTGKKLISGGISRGFRRTAKGRVKERLGEKKSWEKRANNKEKKKESPTTSCGRTAGRRLEVDR